MSSYPKMLYRYPGPVQLEDGAYATLIVQDAQEHADAIGWFESWPAARAAVPAPPAPESTAPTRAELEQKATELGIKFDGRSTDKSLNEAIVRALS